MCVCTCQLCLCLTLYNPRDCSPPGSSVHGSFQSRILEWVAISFSRGSSWPRDWTYVSCVSCIGREILYHMGSSFPWPILKNNLYKVFLEFELLTHSFMHAVIFKCLPGFRLYTRLCGFIGEHKAKPLFLSIFHMSINYSQLLIIQGILYNCGKGSGRKCYLCLERKFWWEQWVCLLCSCWILRSCN